MDRTDAEMMDTETVAAWPQPNGEDVGRELLTLARQLINQGNATHALQAVVMAIRTKGGHEAVFKSLNRARELYRNRLQENTSVEQLATLFAECAIAEVQPFTAEASCDMGGPPIVPNAHGASILAETGRTQIVLDAFTDGSSFICLQCGGLVSNQRKEEHYAYWCGST